MSKPGTSDLASAPSADDAVRARDGLDTTFFVWANPGAVRGSVVRDMNDPCGGADIFRSKVLVVDDMPTNVILLARELSRHGYEVLKAYNGPQALEVARSERPDLILLDLVMPVMDGIEVCRLLKADPEMRSVPIIMVSACDREDEIVRALDAGAHDYITKPVNFRMAMARVRSAARSKAALDQVAEMNTRLADLATRDGLTGVRNYRYFDASLQASCFEARPDHPLSMVMLDIDHFKSYNDRYGHPAGDAVLCAVSDVLRRESRETDLVARYGGEEFALLFPGTGALHALELAERLRAAIEDHPWPLRGITASLGVATVLSPLPKSSSLLTRADQALYRSKHRGRNLVTHFDTMMMTDDLIVSRSA